MNTDKELARVLLIAHEIKEIVKIEEIKITEEEEKKFYIPSSQKVILIITKNYIHLYIKNTNELSLENNSSLKRAPVS